ncbi:hypothetical protein FA95DRAFT_1595907 [Auriscalpium vulgare]|uniref:Uncharacterized protein n=1 Tax=Auriscalpium vulgare TaxID=40419 RepID=A0ACB8RTC9_9AGAM|nr:hypothetical protein FA95DRAFT_1595907 [Auriscalpium vulgare]
MAPPKRKLTGAAAGTEKRKKTGPGRDKASDAGQAATTEVAAKEGVPDSGVPAKEAADAQADKSAAMAHGPAASVETAGAKTNVGEADVPATSTTTDPDTQHADALFVGKFDLFSARIPALGAASAHAELHAALLALQATPRFTARIALRADDGGGRFASPVVCEPMGDEELEPIYVVGGRVGVDVEFEDNGEGLGSEDGNGDGVGMGMGYEARLELDTVQNCMMSAGKGSIAMRKVWDGGDGKEIFRGRVEMKLTYGALLSRKGFGGGVTRSFTFWAVRARKDDGGKEIGIDAGNGTDSAGAGHSSARPTKAK